MSSYFTSPSGDVSMSWWRSLLPCGCDLGQRVSLQLGPSAKLLVILKTTDMRSWRQEVEDGTLERKCSFQ